MTDSRFSDILEVEGVNARGFGTIPKLVMQDMRLTAEAKCVYAYFCSYAGTGNQAFPSVSLVLQHLGLSKDRYYRHLALLKAFGYIRTTQGKKVGRYSKTIYTLVANPVPEPARQASSILPIVPGPPCPCFEDTENTYTENKDTNINSISKLTDLNNSIHQSISNEGVQGEVEGLTLIGSIDESPIEQDKEQQDSDHEVNSACSEEEREVYSQLIAENIFLLGLKAEYGNDELIDNLYDLIVETVTSNKPVIRVGGENKPAALVRSTFLKLNDNHIRYVVEALRANTSKAVNIKAYTLTSLYNAPLTMGAYYANRVQHELYGGGSTRWESPSANDGERRPGRWRGHDP